MGKIDPHQWNLDNRGLWVVTGKEETQEYSGSLKYPITSSWTYLYKGFTEIKTYYLHTLRQVNYTLPTIIFPRIKYYDNKYLYAQILA